MNNTESQPIIHAAFLQVKKQREKLASHVVSFFHQIFVIKKQKIWVFKMLFYQLKGNKIIFSIFQIG